MKISQARIIIFLKQTEANLHYPTYMSLKLKIDYAYLLRILGEMVSNGWIFKESIQSLIPSMKKRSFYHLNKRTYLDLYNQALQVKQEGRQTKLVEEKIENGNRS